MRYIMATAFFLMLGACGSGDTVAVPDGKGGVTTVERDGAKASFTDSEGNVTTVDNNASRADFPDFAPHYPGAKITSVASVANDEGKSLIVNLMTPDASQKVRDFYKAAMEKAGKKVDEINGDGHFLLSTEDEDPGSLITITSEDDGSGTTIAMVLNSKP